MTRLVSAFSRLCLAASLIAACSDDDDTDPTSLLVGTWNVTSFEALGTDFVDQGLVMSIALTSAGTYTITVTNDVIEICEENETQCTETGNYTSTASSITIDSGTADATTFSYTLNGNTMTWTGSIDGTPAEVEMQRAS